MKNSRRRVPDALALISVSLSLLLPFVSHGLAQTGSTSVIGMFPKQMIDFAYADLKETPKYPWFNYMRQQLMPDRFKQFDQFLGSIGLDMVSHLQDFYWGTVAISGGSQQIVGVATGEFDLASTEDHLKSEQLPSFDFHGYKLYAFGGGDSPRDILFTFIDSSTIAFGQRDAVEALIDVRTGAADGLFSNDKIFPYINDASGTGLIWSVLGPETARQTLQDLVADIGQVPQITTISGKLKAMTISVQADGDDGMRLGFQTICDSPDDANLLSAAIEAGLLYQRYRTSGSNSALAELFGQARVMPRGERLEASFSLDKDELEALALNGNFLRAF